ncbi:hypothetical protein [Xanthomonas arboricola]|uniref:hypothetical protein n=1 Tax=Xanthomonas arboricola TaxID=56448 RepID=UPI0011B00CF6|nr:hypothetical protein [Xanthomonas arboricola]
MTTVIITMPTVAAALWQGSIGSFMAFSAFDRVGSSPGPQGQAPGTYIPQRIANDDNKPGQRDPNITQAATKSIAGSGDSATPASGSRGLAGQNNQNYI